MERSSCAARRIRPVTSARTRSTGGGWPTRFDRPCSLGGGRGKALLVAPMVALLFAARKPLSPTDAMFLGLEGPRQPMHVAGLHLYTPPAGSGADFVQKLVEAWREHPQACEPFNQRVKFRLGPWFWEEDTEFELDYPLRHSALPRPGRIRELLSLVSRLQGTLMDRTRPLWEINLIEGLADGRVALCMKVHHSLFDGVAAMKMMAAVLSPDPLEQRPP